MHICNNFCSTLWLGRGVTLKILRPTQQCGGGLEELKPVDQNLQYDFNYQQFIYLPEEITVLPVSACECVQCSLQALSAERPLMPSIVIFL